MAKVHRLPLLLLLLTSLLAPTLAFSPFCGTDALGTYLFNTGFMYNPLVLDKTAYLFGRAKRQYKCISGKRRVGRPTVRKVLCRFCGLTYSCRPDYRCNRGRRRHRWYSPRRW